VSRSTIAEAVRRLVDRGLVDKVRDPRDGRRSVLHATDEGVRVHKRLALRTARMNQVFLAPLEPAEQTLFLDLLRRVSDAAEGLRRPTAPPAAAVGA
jgi:DNA-binding MarR family transcriptional regulator